MQLPYPTERRTAPAGAIPTAASGEFADRVWTALILSVFAPLAIALVTGWCVLFIGSLTEQRLALFTYTTWLAVFILAWACNLVMTFRAERWLVWLTFIPASLAAAWGIHSSMY